MTRGLVIPAVSFLPTDEREFGGLADYQDAVGGFIEPVLFADPSLSLYVNEDGKTRKMSFNERATVLWWQLTPTARERDVIVGDAVFVEESADPQLIALLQRQHGFRVEIQLGNGGEPWVEGAQEFGTWFDAATFALVLRRRFEFVADARVAAV
jgi:hypothetical protein